MDFNMTFEPEYGRPVKVAEGVHRITANNPSPFTFHGTNSYLIGQDTVAILDPGPENDEHLDALLKAIDGRPVSHIFVSHTHRDHSPLSRRLKHATGAPLLAQGPDRPRFGGVDMPGALDASGDPDFVPDVVLADGEVVDGDGWSIRTVLTPGHASNHAAFALEGTGALFSADHVMAWSTSVVAPPDGSMTDYMASLDKLIERDDTLLLPGHGGAVANPRAFMRGLKSHRKMRERAIIERLRTGDRLIPEIVKAIYRETDPKLHGAAALSVLAHIEDLVNRGIVVHEGKLWLDGVFSLA